MGNVELPELGEQIGECSSTFESLALVKVGKNSSVKGYVVFVIDSATTKRASWNDYGLGMGTLTDLAILREAVLAELLRWCTTSVSRECLPL